MKPYLFGIEDMRVLSVRRAQNYPNLTMFDYLDTKIGLIMPYMKVNNELNKRDFTNRNDATKAVTSTNRFVYSYTCFTELGTHSETDFQVYCTRAEVWPSALDYFALPACRHGKYIFPRAINRR